MSDEETPKNVTPIHRGLRSGPSKPSTDTGEVDLPDWVAKANQVGRPETKPDELKDALQRSLEERYPWPEGITVRHSDGFEPTYDADDLREDLRKAMEVRGQNVNDVVEIRRNGELVKRKVDPSRISLAGLGTRSEAKANAGDFHENSVVVNDEKTVQPIRADRPGVWWGVLAGVAFIGIASFAISFGAIFDVAGWTGWALWQKALTPLLFDAGIVVFTFLSFIRLEREQPAAVTFLLAEVLTVMSSVIQVIHTLYTSDRDGIELIVACTIAAMPPLILSACSYLAGRTIFRKRVAS